jgi:hypothetical protein
MNVKRLFSVFSLLGLLLLQPLSAFAAVEGAVAQGIATALAGKTVSDIVNEVRLSGVSLIDQATQSGNALISRAGNETNVLAGNLDVIFKDNMNLTFDRLSEERKAVLIEAEALRRTLASVTDSAYSFKDSTVLDFNSLVTSLPFVKESFFVQSIRGLSYLPQAGDFKLQIAATTLGIQEDVSTTVEVFKGHGNAKQLLPNVIVDQSKQRFLADIMIPNKLFAMDFTDNDLVLLPLTIQFNTSRKKGWWIFSSLEKQVYEVPVYVNLFPRSAGTLVSITKKPTYAWVNAGSKSERYGTPNRHCSKKCGGEPTRGSNRIEFAVSGGAAPYKVGYKRLTNAHQACIGGNCGYSDSFNLRLTENDTRLIFTWDTWSTSGTWEASADILEYQVTGESTDTSGEISASFGKVIEIPISKDATFGILRMHTFTKQEYEIKLGEPDPYGILTYQGTSSAGPETSRVAYRVNDPATVAITKF